MGFQLWRWTAVMTPRAIATCILVKVAVCHYQFEAMQPFANGNGRMGRLLTEAMLVHEELIRQPILQLSGYFDQNRQVYYDALRGVSQRNDWTGWVVFFLRAIESQSQVTVKLINEVQRIDETLKPKIIKVSNEYGERVYREILRRPVFTAKDLRTRVRIDAAQTAYNIIDTLLSERIISDITPDRQRGKQYECRDITRLFNVAERNMY